MTRPKNDMHLAVRVCLVAAALMATGGAAARGTQVIDLTQVACQFLESENGVDRGFESASKSDCKAINNATSAERLDGAKTLELAPGKYIFRVRNRNVPYPVGFWLRGQGLVNRARLPSVSGGGLVQGATRDYYIELEPGSYVYSCPLNPTPDYKLIVKG